MSTLDVAESDEVEAGIIEVEETAFESWDELFAHVKRVLEELE